MSRNGLLLVLLSASAFAGKSNEIPLKEGHFIDAKFAWGALKGDQYTLPVTISVEEGKGTSRLLDPQSEPWESIGMFGKFWMILNEFVANPGFVWKFRDVFSVTDKSGKRWTLDRAELAKYPALLSRMRGAKFSFRKLEVNFTAILDNGRRVPMTVMLDGNDFIIPSEGRSPMMAPVSPLKWSDMVKERSSFYTKGGLPALWRRFTHITDASISIIGFRMPSEELAQIAKDLEARKKELEKEKERYASALGDAAPPGVKPWSGTGPDSEPFEDTKAESFADGKLVGLKSHGRVLASWSSSKYSKPEQLGRSRFHLLRAYGSESQIVDRKGQAQSPGGLTSFDRVEKNSGGTLTLVKVIDRGSEQKGTCYGGSRPTQWFSSSWEAQRAADEIVQAGERKGEALRARGGDGVIICGAFTKYRIVELRRLKVDESLKVLSDERGYEVW